MKNESKSKKTKGKSLKRNEKNLKLQKRKHNKPLLSKRNSSTKQKRKL